MHYRKEFANLYMERFAKLIERIQRDILFLIFDALDCGLCQTCLARELTLREISPPLLDEPCQASAQMNHMWFIL
jgi:hypothetical protein